MLAMGGGGSMAAFWEQLADQVDPERQLDHLASDLPDDPQGWLRRLFPRAVAKPFGDHHLRFWEWVWSIGDAEPRPYVAIYPRGGGKSSSGELSVVALGVRGVRRYAVYVSATQKQANERVQNVAAFLTGEGIRTYYPLHGRRAVSIYGHARAWRAQRIQTAGGLVVDALGLDAAARGMKHEDQRPDLIILDDIDDRHDSAAATKKKEDTLTDTILPTGTPNLAILCLQNLIIPDGVFARLANGKAPYLAGRVVSGPVPAIRGLLTEDAPPLTEGGPRRRIIVGGTPTWEGQGIAECQGLIDRLGLPSFNREQQHEVDEVEGALWKKKLIADSRGAMPEGGFRRIVIGVDPSGGGDEIGIVAVGMGRDGRGYVLADDTQLGRLGPHNWARRVGVVYDTWKADRVVAEKNFGGDLVESNLRTGSGYTHLPVHMVTASRGKEIRAEPVVALYERDLIRHVGTFPELETEQTRWVPGTTGSSPNRLDALVFALTELFLPAAKTRSGGATRPPGL